jgi:fibrillarin-like rRNA methylase
MKQMWNKYHVVIITTIVNIALIIVAVLLMYNTYNSLISKQEKIYQKLEQEKQAEIAKSLELIDSIRQGNDLLSKKIKSVELQINAIYLQKKQTIKKKYDKEISHISNTTVDSTANILTRQLQDSISE